jgi:hypothetical protein
LYHFFRVGLFGAVRCLWPPFPWNFIKAYKVLRAASWIVIPLMKGEKVFWWFRVLLMIVFYKSQKKNAGVAESELKEI